MCTLYVIVWQICIRIWRIWNTKSKSNRFRF